MAIDFNGSTDRIDYGNTRDWSGQAQSISLWFVKDDFSNTSYICTDHGSGDSTLSVILYTQTINTLKFWVNHATTNLSRTSTAVLSTATTYHVVVTWDGSATATNINMYLNGAVMSYSAATDGVDAVLAADGSTALGGRIYDDASNFNGRMWELGRWTRVIAADEIIGLAAGASPSTYMNGLAFYTPLVRSAIDEINGDAGTLDGTSVATHGRIITPSGSRFVGRTPAVGGSFQAAWALGSNQLIGAHAI